MRLPVFVKDAAFEPPDLETYTLVTGDGLYLVRRTPLYTASVPLTGGVPGLARQRPELKLALPRLPSDLLERAVGFFRMVWTRWRGEAILIMFYAPPSERIPGRFVLEAPPQIIPGRFERGRFRAELRLEYGACTAPGPEFRKLGTFHSHGNAGPRHSEIDADDESDETGLHLTAGYVDSRRPEFAAAFVVGGTRFAVRAQDVLSPFAVPRRPPNGWLDQVTAGCTARLDERAWRGGAP